MFLLILLFGAVSFAGAASEANLYFVPSSGTYEKTDEFTVELKLNSQDSITSLKAYITYDPAVLSIESFQVNEAAFPFWLEKESVPGLLKLQASVPAPGFQGEQTIATLRLRTQGKFGDAVILVDPSSLVLNSGDEDVLRISSFSAARFVVGDASALSQAQVFLYVGLVVALILCAAVLFMMVRKRKEVDKK